MLPTWRRHELPPPTWGRLVVWCNTCHPTNWRPSERLGSLTEATRALDDICETLADLDQLTRRLQQDLLALEGAVLGEGHGCKLTEIMSSAERLARHHTKLIGGVTWPDLPGDTNVLAPRGVAISVLSFLVTYLAQVLSRSQRVLGNAKGIQVTCSPQPDGIDLFLHGEGLSGDQYEFAVDQVGMILPDDESIQVCSQKSATIVRFACQSDGPLRRN